MTGQNRQERRWLLAVSLELKIIYIFQKGSRKLKEKNLDKTSLCTRLGSIQLNIKGRSQLGARLTIRPLYRRCFQTTHLRKLLKWELGQVLAIVLEDLGCQGSRPT